MLVPTIVRKYAKFEGKTIFDFIRDAVFEKIEDQKDLATLRAAIAGIANESRLVGVVREVLCASAVRCLPTNIVYQNSRINRLSMLRSRGSGEPIQKTVSIPAKRTSIA